MTRPDIDPNAVAVDLRAKLQGLFHQLGLTPILEGLLGLLVASEATLQGDGLALPADLEFHLRPDTLSPDLPGEKTAILDLEPVDRGDFISQPEPHFLGC